MKKNISDIKTLVALLMAGAAFTACSDKDEIIGEQPVNPATKYAMTVNATKGNDGQTRALSLNNKTLNVKWAATDEVSVFPETWSTTAYGTLTAAASDNGSTLLTGDLTTAPTAGDNLKLLFPRATWNYTGQTGVLLSDANSIEKKYDYALADVTVDEVNSNKITTTGNANFQSQQAIVKFTLQDEGGNALNASNLTISAASNKLVKSKGFRGGGTKTYYYGDSYYSVDNGSGGFNDNEQHGNLVDNNLDNKWCQNKPNGNWYIEFHTASAIHVDGYMLRTGGDTGSNTGRNPKDWVLYGKLNSGDSWTVIDAKTDNYDMATSSDAEQDFDADAPGQYKYFRLEISEVRNGNCMQMSEMRLFSYDGLEMGTTYGSITVTPEAATNEMTVALRNENASADTYTLTANVGGGIYNFTKSGVTFENGKYYAITVKMNPKKVSSISLNKTSANLLVGGNVDLSVSSVSPLGAVDKTVTWSSSNTSVATVNASTGVVTAVAVGTATITATANDGSGKTATCSVTVYPTGTIIWDSSNCSNMYIRGGKSYDKTTIANIKLICNADGSGAYWSENEGGIIFEANASGGFTFVAPTGKKFTKIEMTVKGSSGWNNPQLGQSWSFDSTSGIVTWTGYTADSAADLVKNVNHFSGSAITRIAFYLE